MFDEKPPNYPPGIRERIESLPLAVRLRVDELCRGFRWSKSDDPMQVWEAFIAESLNPLQMSDGEAEPEKPKKPQKEKPKGQGRSLRFDDDEPWPTTVDGATLFEELAQTFRRHIVLPKFGDVAAALWTVNGYVLDVAEAAPRLHIKSPVRECGKTQFLLLLSALSKRPIAVSSTTASPVFRSIEAVQPTLLLDEVDNARLKENDELRAILNSGHTRGTAYVLRAEGDNHEPKMFSTWCSIALAGIGEIPDTTASRSIALPLKKKLATEKVERIREGRIRQQLTHLRRRILKWTEDNSDGLAEADPELPDELGDRAQDNWRPLIAVADLVGGEWPERARTAAKALSLGRLESEESGTNIQLLADVRTVWDEGEGKLFSATLVKRLLAMEDRSWGECNYGRPVSQAGLAERLRGFVPGPKNVRIVDEVKRGWHRSAFEDAWIRYLTARGDGVEVDVAVEDAEFGASVSQCSTVALETPPQGHGDARAPDEEGQP